MLFAIGSDSELSLHLISHYGHHTIENVAKIFIIYELSYVLRIHSLLTMSQVYKTMTFKMFSKTRTLFRASQHIQNLTF